MFNKLFNMKTVSTRELLQKNKEVRAALEMGEPVAWTSRGKLIAHLYPANAKPSGRRKSDWIERAHRAGAVNESGSSASEDLYADRN